MFSRRPHIQTLAQSLAVLTIASCVVLTCATGALAQKPKPLKSGDILSGELTAMRSGPRKKRVVTYQLTSEPRQLAMPGGMCNLETGPETFQIVTSDADEAAALKPFLGKTIALKAEELSCAHAAGQWSDAIVSKWSLATKH